MRWLTIAAGVALAAMYAAWSVQVADLRASHATALAAEQKLTSDAKAEVAAYKLEVEKINADNAREFADATRALWLEERAQAKAADTARAKAAAEQRRREAKSSELLRILNDAKPEDVAPIGPAVRDFLDRVRREQRSAAVESDQATRGNAN